MNFEEDYVYHVYNRGNNRQRIFLEDENYRFFLRKVQDYLLPHSNLLAYCLMPNHFHFLLQAKSESPAISQTGPGNLLEPPNIGRTAWSSGTKPAITGQTAPSGQTGNHPLVRKIGTLLSSYTQAMNKRYKRSGSFFQQKTKAKQINFSRSRVDYAFSCFQYIHRNPVEAGLVDKMEDWEFSSFREYINTAKRQFCDQKLAEEIINFDKENFYSQSYQAMEETKMLFL